MPKSDYTDYRKLHIAETQIVERQQKEILRLEALIRQLEHKVETQGYEIQALRRRG